MFEEMKR